MMTQNCDENTKENDQMMIPLEVDYDDNNNIGSKNEGFLDEFNDDDGSSYYVIVAAQSDENDDDEMFTF